MVDRAIGAFVLLVSLAVGGCGIGQAAKPSPSPSGEPAPSSVVIAYQTGISYAPLLIMKQQRMIEQEYPETKVEYRLVPDGDAIRDGIAAGRIQVGAGSIGPFLVGWAGGVDYQLVSSMDRMDLWLDVRDAAVRSLKDVKPGMKIAVPALDSAQAVALRRLAEVQLGDAHRLDANLVAMANPDGMQALMAGTVTAHMAAAPYQFQEIELGARTIARSSDAFGPSTFISAYTTRRFYDRYQLFVRKLYAFLQQAIVTISIDVAGAASLVATADGQPQMAARYRDWMTRPGIDFNTRPTGFLQYAQFMKRIDAIPRAPASIQDLELPFLQQVGGD